MDKKIKASINIISSRDKCLPRCLKSVWDSWNKNYNYPVYVYYFDDIYDSPDYRNNIYSATPQDVRFLSVPYKTPPLIPDQELFYNRQNLAYARSFGAKRKGYLHMCHFKSNMYNYPGTHIADYDYIMIQDDEAGYNKPLPTNPFTSLAKSSEMIGAFAVNQRLHNGHPHQGHLDTRVGLWQFTKEFLSSHQIKPKSPLLQELIHDKNGETNYHYIKWLDTYVINTAVFRSPLWKKWINAVNESGGIYKYRWGDNEIITLFTYMSQEEPLDLQLDCRSLGPSGYFDSGKFRHIQDIAPAIQNLRK